ncbi:LutC/YkgG family protein [Yinghuangia soli]|uniref:Lactate utilization protein C n=1 Tax=Yinghuangia soli TaxID=2908204 RepID=A0AA41U806_9ACTN|nr:lactate utilization protein C [Yinghuangia soli]MCF2532439.1 lactate utilization protein C [Yinghuangia soli]
MTDSRARILGRIRTALAGTERTTPAPAEPIARDYRDSHTDTGLVELLAHNLADYRARVHHATETDLPDLIARLLGSRGAHTLVVPPGLPDGWLPTAAGLRAVRGTDLSAAELDAMSSVLTGCAVAVAETGTIVLDGGPGQGRRMLTLVPDHHICVVRTPDQVVASVPQALRRLDPRRPQTWISGPSATSDIELDRVEGVHGPRALDVVLLVPPGGA